MRKYVITLIDKGCIMPNFSMESLISHEEIELKGHLTKKDFNELVKNYGKASKCVLAITDVTGEK